MPDLVTVVSPDGSQVGDIPADRVDSAIGSGWRLETPEEAERRRLEEEFTATGSAALAAGAGVARGLTLGLSDQFLVKTKLVDEETLRNLREFQPEASIIGEAAGVIAPLALTGGAGAIALAGRGAGAAVRGVAAAGKLTQGAVLGKVAAPSLARKAAARGLATATEGAFFSTGHLISEEALGRAELNAENLLWHTGVGAALGGVVGSSIPVLGDSVARAIAAAPKPRLMKAGLNEILKDFSEEQALKAVVGSQAKARKLFKEGDLKKRAIEFINRENIVTIADTPQSIAAKIAAQRDRLGRQLDDITGSLDAMHSQIPEQFPQMQNVIKRLNKEVFQPISKVETKAVRNSIRKEIDDIAETLGKEGSVTFGQLRQKRGAIDKLAKWERATLGPREAQFRKMSSILNQEVDEAAEPLLKSIGHADAGRYAQIRRDLGMAIELGKLSGNLAANSSKRSIFGLYETIAGAAGVLAGDARPQTVLDNLVRGAAFAGSINVLRSRLAPVSSSVARQVSSMTALELAKLGRLKAVKEAVGKFVKLDLDRLVAPVTIKVFGDVAFGKGEGNEKLKSQISEVNRLIVNQDQTLRDIAGKVGDISEVAPKTAAAISTKMMNALTFLESKAPKPPEPAGGLALFDVQEGWEPPSAELHRWRRYLTAVERPQTVVDNLANGVVSREEIEALRAVYPEIYSDILREFSEILSENQDMARAQKDLISILFGIPATSLNSPNFVRNSQSLFDAAEGVPRETQRQPRVTATGLAKLKVAGGHETKTQRVQQL